ncbi:MAG: hypothetical protein GXP04_09130 [Alphaproteobacteria bacterium]|nr:hypothetical protein [Alphaproteobacteria bacterium]
MMKHIFAVILAAGLGSVTAPATAQQELQLRVLNDLGAAALEQDGYGCFDPLAALFFDEDIMSGGISGATRQFFEVGSCVTLQQGVTLVNAQRISLEGQAIVRGAFSGVGVTVYIPDWSAALGDAHSGYDMGRVSLAAPLNAISADLRARVDAHELCLQDGEALEARIAEYNVRAAALSPDREGATTGSRLIRGVGAVPVFSIVLADERHRALHEEAMSLQDAVAAYMERCSNRDSITLDQDYMAFYRAGI